MAKEAPEVEKVAEAKPTVEAKPVSEVKKSSAMDGVFVRAVHGEMRHLFTNVVFNGDPKKVEIDGFLQAQIDAGKLEVVQP